MEIAELQQLHDRAFEKQKEWINYGELNARFLKGKHWTADEIKDHEKEWRIAYNIPLVATKINRILSEQRNNRFQYKLRGRGEEDELQAEIDTQLLRYIDDFNQFKYIESEVYQDGLAKIYGVLHVREDYILNPEGEVVLEHVPYDEVCWDWNNKKYDLSDIDFFERFAWVTRRKLKQLYPEKKKEIDQIFEDCTKETGKSQEQYFKKDKGSNLVKVIWHYQRVIKQTYRVKDIETKELLEFKDLKSAEAYVNSKVANIPDPNLMVMAKEQYKMFPVNAEKWEVTCWSATQILATDEVEDLPYVVYFAMYDTGECWSLVDLARDSQRAMDRLMSMMDKSTSKNIKGNNYMVDVNRLANDIRNNPDPHLKKLAKGGYFLKVESLEKGDVIRPIDKQNNIAVEIGLFQMLQGILEDLLGGRTFQGLESKGKTATEANILEQASKMTALLYIDNLIRWKLQVGNLVYKTARKVYTYEKQLQILGEVFADKVKMTLETMGIYKLSQNQAGLGYLKYNKDGKRLTDTNMDVIIDQVELSTTVKMQKYAMLMSYNDVMLQRGYEPLPAEILFKYADIDPTDKAVLQQYQQAQQERQAQQAEQASRVQEAELIAKYLPKIKEMGEQNGNNSNEDKSPVS